MRRPVSVLAAAVLALGALAAHDPADGPPPPVDLTFHLHGDGDGPAAETHRTFLDGTFLPMDLVPAEGDAVSKQVTNYGIGPNPNCTGNNLLPTWSTFVLGSLVGEATLTIDVASTGGPLVAQVFAGGAQACNEGFVPPIAEVTVEVTPGLSTVEVPLNFGAGSANVSQIVLMLRPADGVATFDPQVQHRVFFDGADQDATLQLTCQPQEDSNSDPNHDCQFG